MIIDLKDPNPPIKMSLGKDKKDEAFVMLRPASGAVLEKIRKKTYTRKFKNVRGVIHEYFDIDEDAYDFLLWGYCLTGWGGIEDADGTTIEYDPKVAVNLIKESPYFNEILGEKLDKVKEIIEKRAKAAKKNS